MNNFIQKYFADKIKMHNFALRYEKEIFSTKFLYIMKAKFIVMSLLAIFCLTVNAQTVNEVEVAAKKEAVKGAKKEAVKGAKKEAVKGAKKEAVKGAKKEAVKGAKKEAVKGAKKEAVKGAKKEAVKGAKKEAVKAATKETVNTDTYKKCRDDRAAVKASTSKKELRKLEKANKKAKKNNK